MILKELEIQGFKSFPDKIKVQIRPGITAVVGPNGSGKSNISDAIRWVLGETSSRQLRGSGKMEDVIFGGTQRRGAMGFASVHLTLDNTDRRLDVDSDEVVIGRKYYRSGESEYSINGQNVRLKDVYELLLDTGLGRDGYSIIGQGKIAEIVGVKSGERREIFEEASGIARYRYRKNEAERSLEAAEENLVRLRDILSELEDRVGPLEKESEKAKKYLELAQTRKELEVTLWVEKIRRARETVRAQQRNLETAQADYDRLSGQIQSLDEETEQIRRESERMIVENERCGNEIRSLQDQIAGLESQRAVLNNDMAHNRESMDAYREEIRQSEAGGQEIARAIEEHRAQIARQKEEIAGLDAQITHLEEQLEELQKQNESTGERRGAVAALLARLTASQTEERVSQAAENSAAENARQRLEQSGADRAQTGSQLERDREEAGENRKYLEKLEADLTRLQNIKGGLTLKLEGRRRQLGEADETEQRVSRSLDAARQRLSVLSDLEKNMDGYQQSVRSVMRAAQNHRLRGIVGPVGSILKVKPGYETAIETALGFAAQNIVVDGESSAKSAIAFLKAEKGGRATFLPMDTMQGQHMDQSRLPSGQVASSLVEYDPRYDRIVANLLGRIVVVEDLDEASRVARALSYRNRVVTVDGQVINAGGSFTGGSTSRSAGLFSRRQEMEELKGRIRQLTQQEEQAQENTDKWKAEVDGLTAQLTAVDSEIVTAQGDKIRAEMEQNRLDGAVSQGEAALTLLEGEAEELQKTLAQSEANGRRAQAELERLAGEIQKLEGELNQLEGSDDSFLTTRSRLSEELTAARMDRLAADKDVERLEEAIRGLESRTGEAGQRRQELNEAIGRLEETNRNLEEQIRGLAGQAETWQNEIKTLEKRREEAAARRMELDASLTGQNQKVRAVTDQREECSRELARLAERKDSAEQEYDQTVSRLWDEYELAVSDAEKLCVAFESLPELNRRVNEVRGKIRALGNVNVNAIEEFDQVNRRYQALKAQVEDVEKSRAELIRMVQQLSGEMKKLFTASFAQINENFGRIFNELFGGGTASLELTDQEDVLESGIEIHVAPPGKVIKNLSALSGGEQSLVAICIYFAILAVNPAPFCILDEIEAALDDVNVVRYAQYLRRITENTQFIVITHRRGTMEAADVLYGVTMQEDGVSKLLKLDLDTMDASLVN
ncbi:MAG: chromosome segregation protein SMC [Bacteroidales bacterium]|nr:chromosome segregation protein SMC [Bacteroidales bacterium]